MVRNTREQATWHCTHERGQHRREGSAREEIARAQEGRQHDALRSTIEEAAHERRQHTRASSTGEQAAQESKQHRTHGKTAREEVSQERRQHTRHRRGDSTLDTGEETAQVQHRRASSTGGWAAQERAWHRRRGIMVRNTREGAAQGHGERVVQESCNNPSPISSGSGSGPSLGI